jgi:hypothetical protein
MQTACQGRSSIRLREKAGTTVVIVALHEPDELIAGAD